MPGCIIMRFQWKMISYFAFLLRKGLITWQCDLWYTWLWLTHWRSQVTFINLWYFVNSIMDISITSIIHLIIIQAWIHNPDMNPNMNISKSGMCIHNCIMRRHNCMISMIAQICLVEKKLWISILALCNWTFIIKWWRSIIVLNHG